MRACKEWGEILFGCAPRGRKDRRLRRKYRVNLRVVSKEEQQIQSERVVRHTSAHCCNELRDLSRTAPSAALDTETARIRYGDHQLGARSAPHSAQHNRMRNAEHVTGTRLHDPQRNPGQKLAC